MKARKRFGQHFLTDSRVAEGIADLVDARGGEVILEVGPGRGALTAPLVRRYGRILGVEIDRDLIGVLQKRFPSHQLGLMQADILDVDLASVLAAEGGTRLVVVGNVPYNITAPLLFRLLDQRPCLDRALLMLQREVAQRLTAGPGGKEYGRITIQLGLWAEVRLVMAVPPGAFHPVPRVHSAVVECRFARNPRYPVGDERMLRRVLGAAFGQRRKMLRNSLMSVLPLERRGCISAVAANTGLDLTRRPEQLTPEEFCRLSDAFQQVEEERGVGEADA